MLLSGLSLTGILFAPARSCQAYNPQVLGPEVDPASDAPWSVRPTSSGPTVEGMNGYGYARSIGMFGKLLQRPRTPLVTCILQRQGDGWQATWASGGRVPADFSAGSLSAAAERATTETTALYADQRLAAQAELQLAIYPWADTTAKVILDIDSDSDGFIAWDVEGSGILVRGESLESLVREAEMTLPNPHDGMLRWVRPMSALPVS